MTEVDQGQHWRRVVLCLVSGLLLALAFSTHATAWLVWVAMVPFFFVLFQHPPQVRAYARYSWLFGMGFYIGVIHWLKELHPLTWMQGITEPISYTIVYTGIFGISLVVSLWLLLYGVLLGLLKPTGYRQIVYPALLWMLMEFVQAYGTLSLPWARLAISQYKNLWLLQIVPHTGQLVISGLIVACNAAIARFVLDFAPDARPKAYWHYAGFRALLVVLGLVGANLMYGAQRLQAAKSLDNEPNPLSVGLIQGSIPQGQKWTTANEFWKNVQEIDEIYEKLSRQAIAVSPNDRLDLLVWPESAVPISLRAVPEYRAQFGQAVLDYQARFGQLARESKGFFLSGTFDQQLVNQPQPKLLDYNAAVLINPQGQMQSWYYKRQLVPFGEFFPYRYLLEGIPFLGSTIAGLNPMKKDVAPGQTPGLFETDFGKLGTLICFESVYPQVARSSVQAGANLLVVITNDGWYRDAIALYQHLGHAVLRALENGRYLVRAGNTGISAFVDPYGRIELQSLPMDRTYLTHPVPRSVLQAPLTLYTRFGDWPLWLALLALLGLEITKKRQGLSETANSSEQSAQTQQPV